jgi:hypothetical protein
MLSGVEIDLGNGFAGVFNQFGNAIARLGAVAFPVLNALLIQEQALFGTTRQRIEETDALDITTVATVSAVGNYYVVERTVFRATSG